jgi:hypothetical protein
MLSYPSVTEERWLVLAGRWPDAQRQADFALHTGGWRSVGLVTRLAFFVLGIVAAWLTSNILSLLKVPGYPLVSALVLLIAAEWLIARYRLFRAGLGEALHVAGLMLVAFWCTRELARFDTTVGAASFTAALLLAGWRLRNPLFTTWAALWASLLVALLSDDSGWFFGREGSLWATGFCMATALAALALGARVYARPSRDRMLDWLVVAMPVGAYLWTTFISGSGSTINLHAVLGLLLFGATALIVGIRRRTHAPLWSCMACIACLGVELRSVTGWTLTTRLVVWGIGTLIVALALNRWLRRPRGGITSARCDDREGPLDLLPLAGAAAIAPQAAPDGPRGIHGGGGGFGGGGADGRF